MGYCNHWKGTCLDEIGRQSVRAEFLKHFDFPWSKIKYRRPFEKNNMMSTKRITQNTIGMGFNEFGDRARHVRRLVE